MEGIMKRAFAVMLVIGVATFCATAPALAGWAIWQTSSGYCGLFEDGKPKGQDYVKQVESTHATYKDALMRIQQLLKNKTCTPKPS
jgi:hypothetical protein